MSTRDRQRTSSKDTKKDTKDRLSLRSLSRASGGTSKPTGERRALWFLKKIPLFQALGQNELAELLELVEIKELKRRQVIYLPGDPGSTVYFINGGRVKLSKVTRDGREITLAYLGPGELFGELCLFTGNPRQEMAETVENCLITEVDRKVVETMLSANAEVLLSLFKVIISRRADVETKVEYLVFRDVSAKLAELLLNLGEQYGVEDQRGLLLGVKITHQEIANLIGSTRETVSLTLSQFKRKGYIKVDRRKVILIDIPSLKGLT